MIKLAISNIGWSKENDDIMYSKLKEMGYDGVEIAPTRIFESNPYDCLVEAKEYSDKLYKEHGLCIPSMQSIWYGMSQKMFETKEERQELLAYTKKAILFAEQIGCKNLVFGCPRNRVTSKEEDYNIAIDFFRKLGEYAKEHNTVLAMEANPPMYNTNFINETKQAIDIVKEVNSEGFLVNLDLGTVIANEEDINIIKENINLINHIHISEPGLKLVEKRNLHLELVDILKSESYDKYVSIEIGKQDELSQLEDVLNYVKEVFNY